MFTHFSKRKIMLFALPTIGALLVYNIYTMVDGYFISNYLGNNAFAAESLISPLILLVLCLGSMFGVGGNALISYMHGENDDEGANRCFTQTVASLIFLTSVIALLFWIFMPTLSRLVGAKSESLPLCVRYGRLLSVFIPVGVLFFAFQSLLVSAGKTKFGFLLMVASAAANFILDYLLVAVKGMGLVGGAIGTIAGWAACAVPAFIYFCRPESKPHFVRFRLNLPMLKQTAWNGLSEMVDSSSVALVSILYNRMLMRFYGETGVSAGSVGTYVSSIFLSVSMGISISVTAAVAYHYGKGNHREVLALRKNGMQLNLMLGCSMLFLSRILAKPIAELFVGYDFQVCALAVHALNVFSFAFPFSGVTVFAAGFYTGLNDGSRSAMIAGAKALLFPCILIAVCRIFSFSEGLWYVTPAAEMLTVILVLLFFRFHPGIGPAGDYSGAAE